MTDRDEDQKLPQKDGAEYPGRRRNPVITHGKLTGGSKLTRDLAQKHGKPCLFVDMEVISVHDAVIRIKAWIWDEHIKILNVAGTRASKDPRIYGVAHDILLSICGH